MIELAGKMTVITTITIIGLLSVPIPLLTEREIDATTNCDSSYPDACIPSPPPNLNCADISDKRFEVSSPDPHGFDRDKDGIGCES